MSFATGEVVGDYQVLGVLGHGGMGAVYRVRNLLSHREEAMKVVLPEADSSLQAAERFLREIRVQASLRHPNIAELRTAVRAGDHVLMILELIDGWSVAARLKEGPMRFDAAFRVVDDILGALAYAHKHGVVHRDIKPANIMVTMQGMTKLTDFGIARSASEDRITQTSAAVGSLHYMSPEQIQSNIADERSDLYSLGVAFYEMLTGRLPVAGQSAYAVMHAHMTLIPAPPSQVVPGIPLEISRVVMKALAKSPQERFDSAPAFQTALRDALFGAPATGPVATVAAPVASSGTQTGQSVPAFDPAELRRVETLLAGYVGPIAKSLVRNAARRCSSIPSLCLELSGQIQGMAERVAFLKAFGIGSGSKPTTAAASQPSGSGAAQPAAPISDEVLQGMRKALAEYLGPMAKMIVERTAKRAQSLEELRETLAAEIPDERGQKAFRERFKS